MLNCKSASIHYRFIEITAPDREIRKRLQSRERGKTAVSDARQEDFEMLSGRYEALTAKKRTSLWRAERLWKRRQLNC